MFPRKTTVVALEAARRSAARRPHVAGIAPNRAARQVGAAPPSASTSRRSSAGRGRETRVEDRRDRRALPRARGRGRHVSALLVLGRSLPDRLRPPRRTASGSRTTTAAPGGARRAAPSPRAREAGARRGRPGGRPRSSDSRSAATSGRPANRPGRRSRRAARVERVGKRSESGRAVEARHRVGVRWVSGSNVRRLSMVSPKSSIRTGRSRSEGKMSTMPPRRANWPGAVTGSSRRYPPSSRASRRISGVISSPALRVSTRVARRGGRGSAAGGRPARRPRRAPGPGRAGGPRPGEGRRPRAAADPGRGAGRAPGRRAPPREAGLGGEGSEVLSRVVDVALARRHDEEGLVRHEQGDEEARGAGEARQLGPAPPRKRLGSPRSRRWRSGESGLHGPADAVDDGGRRSAGKKGNAHDPAPAAQTVARPTISSSAQSAPFTRTSGASASIAAAGVGSS